MTGIVLQLTEAEFQAQVIQYAVLRGWDWMHVERMGDRKGWRTPTKGTIRQWPDLTLLRGHRMVYAELKAQKAPPPPQAQKDVLSKLSMVPGNEVYVWRPSDWPLIAEVLA